MAKCESVQEFGGTASAPPGGDGPSDAQIVAAATSNGDGSTRGVAFPPVQFGDLAAFHRPQWSGGGRISGQFVSLQERDVREVFADLYLALGPGDRALCVPHSDVVGALPSLGDRLVYEGIVFTVLGVRRVARHSSLVVLRLRDVR